MRKKKFSSLRKGDILWVFNSIDNRDTCYLRKCVIKHIKREKPMELPMYSSKWIVHYDEEPFRMIIDTDNGKSYFISKDNFERNLLMLDTEDLIECTIISTSKDSIKERLINLATSTKNMIDSELSSYLEEVDNVK